MSDGGAEVRPGPTETVVIDSIRCHSPDPAEANENYPPESFGRPDRLEQGHFWFRARNRILLAAVERNLELSLVGRPRARPSSSCRAASIGCSAGSCGSIGA